MARAMLNNDNSPYYSLIEDTLRHMDKEKLIEFGMNLGYNGCTQGAHIVRKIQDEPKISMSRGFFSLNYLILPTQICAPVIRPSLTRVKNLESMFIVFTLMEIRKNFLPLIEHNPDCAMILLCNSAAVTEDFAKAAESLNNMLIGVAYDDNTDTTCLVLRDHRLLYSIYRMYTDTESDEILSGSYARFAEEMHCPFVAVLADPGCSASVRENVYKAVVGARVAQKYRTIPIDLFYDIERIGNIISPPSSIIGFKPDGSIYNIGSDGNPLEHNIFNESLRDILKESFSMDQES